MRTPSVAVRSFADLALRHALRSVVPDGGPLMPFAMMRVDGALTLRWCLADDLTAALVTARSMVRDVPGVECAAVAWDVEAGERGTCRVFVEVSDGPGQQASVYGQLYRDRRLLRRAVVLGEPHFLGSAAPLF